MNKLNGLDSENDPILPPGDNVEAIQEERAEELAQGNTQEPGTEKRSHAEIIDQLETLRKLRAESARKRSKRQAEHVDQLTLFAP